MEEVKEYELCDDSLYSMGDTFISRKCINDCKIINIKHKLSCYSDVANLTRFDSALELPVTRVSCTTKSGFKRV